MNTGQKYGKETAINVDLHNTEQICINDYTQRHFL